MYNKTSYVAHTVNENGVADYSAAENAVWHELITRQNTIIQNRACDEYIQGLQKLNLSTDQIPQCHEISAVLKQATGWTLEPVAALISFDKFFNLLANRKFPAATFIRTRDDLDYIKEPDIFHEIYGHCPLLTNPAYAEFTHTYGRLGLEATPQERVLLARLFWFTVEFGLIQTSQGLRAYGGGILSSKDETIYCLESKTPERRPFAVLDALKTSYRIDIIQPIYFVINSFEQLFDLTKIDLLKIINEIHLSETVPQHPC